MVAVELRPLPGVGGAEARVLTRDEFEVKSLERASRSDPARYVLVLRQPVALGTRVVVRLRLSLEDKEGESFREIAFRTAEPFRVAALGCREKQVPVTPGGTRYAKEQALACPGQRLVVVEFSATPKLLGPVEGRNLVRLEPRRAQPRLQPAGPHPRGHGRLRVGHPLLGRPGSHPASGPARARAADDRPQRGVPALPPPARLRAPHRRTGHRRALRPADGAGGRPRPGAPGPAHPQDRPPRPLVLAVPGPSARARRERAAPRPRRGAARPTPTPRATSPCRSCCSTSRPSARRPSPPSRPCP